MNEQEAEKTSAGIFDPLIDFNNWLGENAMGAVDEKDNETFVIWESVIDKFNECMSEMSKQLSDVANEEKEGTKE